MSSKQSFRGVGVNPNADTWTTRLLFLVLSVAFVLSGASAFAQDTYVEGDYVEGDSVESHPKSHDRENNYQRATFSIGYGPTIGKANGDRDTNPSLWIDGAGNIAGPLQLGLYAHINGSSWGLRNPAIGGGGLIQLRPTFGLLHIIAGFHGGRERFPYNDAKDDGVWAIGGTAGLGVGLVRWLSLEGRARYNHYFKERASTPNDNWTVEGALAFHIW